MKLREGGLDNRALVLLVGLNGLKRLSRLSLGRKGRPIPSHLGFVSFFGGTGQYSQFSPHWRTAIELPAFLGPLLPNFLFPRFEDRRILLTKTFSVLG